MFFSSDPVICRAGQKGVQKTKKLGSFENTFDGYRPIDAYRANQCEKGVWPQGFPSTLEYFYKFALYL
jgi:hypothetical protein